MVVVSRCALSMEAPQLSADFQRLYCDKTIFTSFSALHPIRFSRVLPFQHPDEGVDDGDLLRAEANHLAKQCDATRLAVVDEYSRCGLIEETEAGQLRAAIDFFDEDFFELMGMVYANVGRSRCALRWYGEQIRRLESQ